MVLDRRTGQITHRTFHDILDYLRPGDLLVGNDSRTIPARLHGVKPTGGTVEIFLLRPAQDPVQDTKNLGIVRDFARKMWPCGAVDNHRDSL
jgi:S-adenosylmethionine:tRNA-ribosyltransferase-isomerase (queuine synthetase)